MPERWTRSLGLLILCISCLLATARADSPPRSHLFRRDNLVAWCIVPYDAKKRGPEERAEMLKRLGFSRFAYDWRAEHVPTFDAEMDQLKKHGIALSGFWCPAGLNPDSERILALLKRHKLKTQLWVAMDDPAPQSKDQAEKVAAAVRILKPLADEAGKIGCSVGLYNHGGWFGEPENQIKIVEALRLPNVGIVYNLHHGHDHLDRFPALMRAMAPHLMAVNVNGMVRDGERSGKKILPLGQGDLDLGLLKIIADSGYRGPIGILGHTMDDAEARLKDNLDGLDWLLPQLDGKPAGPKPRPRTHSEPAPVVGWGAEGRDEYRTPPLTVECRVKLSSKANFNILVASDTKRSGAHWELFSMAGDGTLAVYTPGMRPDHVRSTANICDGRRHDLAMQFEPRRIRLYSDGKLVADQAMTPLGKAAVPGGLAFGRLVEGGFGCDGTLDYVRISKGVREIPPARAVEMDDRTIGLWRFEGKKQQPIEDLSKRKNHAKAAALAAPVPNAFPSPGNHLVPADPRLKAVLIDRSVDDAYMAVKVDGLGRLFVGGREAVYLFEPDARGGYGPRRELLKLPQDSVVIGLEFRGDDLYVQADSALYLVPGGRVRRAGLKLKRLVWGVPLNFHNSFHCLAWGPAGDLYLDHGDPLLDYGDWERPDHWGHWTLFSQPDGTKTPYNGSGAVLRVKPDGSDLSVVAGGFRGPVGLTFDPAYNLFTNDNDHESRADQYAPARLMHVTPGADFGWPRGWMASKSPDRADLLEPMIATLGRGVPCDLVYYDEPLMADVLGRDLLMCRWDRMTVNRYRVEPRGASFSATEQPFLNGRENARPVGVAVGRGGRVFVTSLYLAGNVVTPHCPSDLVMLTRADDPSDHPFEALDLPRLSADRLWTELSESSWERRSRAHQEILRRGGPLLVEATRRLGETNDNDLALTSLIWLAGAGATPEAARALTAVAARRLPDARLQAIRALAEFPRLNAPAELFTRALADADPRVRMAALAHFTQSSAPPPFGPVAKLAESSDTYVRQSASRLLGRRASAAELRGLMQAREAGNRLAGVLALGARLTVVPTIDEPPSHLPLFFPANSAFFPGTIHYADSPGAVDLRSLGRVGSYTTAQRWKAEPPNPEREGLHELLVGALKDPADSVALQASYFLSVVRDPRSDRLAQETRRRLRPEKPAAPSGVPSESLLASRVKEAAGAENVAPEFLALDWPEEVRKGDGARGRKLFGTLGCVKCHAIGADQKGGGAPSLADLRPRFTVPNIVESIMLPSKQVAAPFQGSIIATKSGQVVTGLVVNESAEQLEVLLPDASRRVVPKAEVEERTVSSSSPMPAGIVKTPAELRDLLAYLLSDKPAPP